MPEYGYLTVAHVPSPLLEHGTNSVIRVESPDGEQRVTAIVDEKGYLRVVGTDQYVPVEWNVRADGDTDTS